MKIPVNLIAGAAGALLLNVVHELARKTSKEAPHVNELGEEGLAKLSEAIGVTPPSGGALYASTLAGDFISNSFFYSAVGKGKPTNIWLRGAALGLTAGLGALTLPSKLGLNDKPVNRTALTQVLTVAWYTLGGLAAAGVADLLQGRNKNDDETAREDVQDTDEEQ